MPPGFIVNSDPTFPTKRSNTRRPAGSGAAVAVGGNWAPVVGEAAGRETAIEAAPGVAAGPLHALVTIATANSGVASRRRAIDGRASTWIERIIRVPCMRSSITFVGRTWDWESFDSSPPEGIGRARGCRPPAGVSRPE
jgi:hypothetical protein